jgi:hypothetical protein
MEHDVLRHIDRSVAAGVPHDRATERPEERSGGQSSGFPTRARGAPPVFDSIPSRSDTSAGDEIDWARLRQRDRPVACTVEEQTHATPLVVMN